MNWKKGMTRLYVVVWGAWSLTLAGATFGTISRHSSADGVVGRMIGVVLIGVILPGVLLFALRWAFDGFTATKT